MYQQTFGRNDRNDNHQSSRSDSHQSSRGDSHQSSRYDTKIKIEPSHQSSRGDNHQSSRYDTKIKIEPSLYNNVNQNNQMSHQGSNNQQDFPSQMNYKTSDTGVGMSAGTLGTADYTKIVKALETLKSNSILNNNNNILNESKPTDSNELVTPVKEEKEKKKKKKHKKEKKKDIKRRLEKKLAELATLNEQSDGQTNDTESIEGGKPPGTLSIQLNNKASKFNLKIESPVLKGNVFQKYKAAQLLKTDSPLFPSKHVEHTDRKYRKITESAKDEDEKEEVEEKTRDDGLETKEDLLKMLGMDAPAKEPEKPKQEVYPVLYSGSEDGEVVSDEELEERRKIREIIQRAKEEALKEPMPKPVSLNIDDQVSEDHKQPPPTEIIPGICLDSSLPENVTMEASFK